MDGYVMGKRIEIILYGRLIRTPSYLILLIGLHVLEIYPPNRYPVSYYLNHELGVYPRNRAVGVLFLYDHYNLYNKEGKQGKLDIQDTL